MVWHKKSLSSLVFCKSITSSHPEICLGASFSTSFLSSVCCLWRALWGLQKRKKLGNNADDCCNIFITTDEGLNRLHYYLFNISVDSKHWKNFENCIQRLLHNSLSSKLNNGVNAIWPQLLEKTFEKHGNLSDFVGMWHGARHFIWIWRKQRIPVWKWKKVGFWNFTKMYRNHSAFMIRWRFWWNTLKTKQSRYDESLSTLKWTFQSVPYDTFLCSF